MDYKNQAQSNKSKMPNLYYNKEATLEECD